MKTFYIRGKVTDWYKGMLIDAPTEQDAIVLYEEELLTGNVASISSDLETWNEIEEEKETE